MIINWLKKFMAASRDDNADTEFVPAGRHQPIRGWPYCPSIIEPCAGVMTPEGVVGGCGKNCSFVLQGVTEEWKRNYSDPSLAPNFRATNLFKDRLHQEVSGENTGSEALPLVEPSGYGWYQTDENGNTIGTVRPPISGDSFRSNSPIAKVIYNDGSTMTFKDLRFENNSSAEDRVKAWALTVGLAWVRGKSLDENLSTWFFEEAWQPIDTAPKDGRPVLLFLPTNDGAAIVARFDPYHFDPAYDDENAGAFVAPLSDGFTRGVCDVFQVMPTHWSPISAPAR